MGVPKIVIMGVYLFDFLLWWDQRFRWSCKEKSMHRKISCTFYTTSRSTSYNSKTKMLTLVQLIQLIQTSCPNVCLRVILHISFVCSFVQTPPLSTDLFQYLKFPSPSPWDTHGSVCISSLNMGYLFIFNHMYDFVISKKVA